VQASALAIDGGHRVKRGQADGSRNRDEHQRAPQARPARHATPSRRAGTASMYRTTCHRLTRTREHPGITPPAHGRRVPQARRARTPPSGSRHPRRPSNDQRAPGRARSKKSARPLLRRDCKCRRPYRVVSSAPGSRAEIGRARRWPAGRLGHY
jgi:hypothetical protein